MCGGIRFMMASVMNSLREIVGGEQQRGAGDAGEPINGNVCVALVAR